MVYLCSSYLKVLLITYRSVNSEAFGLGRHDPIKEWLDSKAVRGWTGRRWVELRLLQWSRFATSSRWLELTWENTTLENGSRIRVEISWRHVKLNKVRSFVRPSPNLISARDQVRDTEIDLLVLKNEPFRDFRDPTRVVCLDLERRILSTTKINSLSSLAALMSTTSTPTSKACRPSATIDGKTSKPQTTRRKSPNLPSFCLKRTKVELCPNT